MTPTILRQSLTGQIKGSVDLTNIQTCPFVLLQVSQIY